ncbi:flagellar hook protein FlgE [Brucella intermedia]|uniref:flagellar hook protein FlgE n=1 Tax=Brucella TaxID=234 RepID=UPI000946158A|nr:flagellar hook protein FlgE [Brucella intermedia]
MSLYGMMRTGVSGMNAQANRLSAVADNIANATTTGYKRANTQFSSLVLPNTAGQYNSGSVLTNVRYGISEQGGLRGSSSATDLAIEGNGYFMVRGADGSTFLTRAGSFVPDKEGNLVNSAGYYLLGAGPDDPGGALTTTGLGVINTKGKPLPPVASTSGKFTFNVPPTDKVVGEGEYNRQTSIIAYNSKGEEIKLDVSLAKTADNKWNVTVKNAADGKVLAGPHELTFDAKTGVVASGGELAVNLKDYGGENIKLDLSEATQRAGDYAVSENKCNGQPPSSVKRIGVAQDGAVVAVYENGVQKVLARIPLANVASPDNMTVVSGNVFLPSAESGDIQLGYPQSKGMGRIMAGALEESNADIAQELTDMIEAQRSYTANSKSFQTASELMDVLVNLKR